MDSHRGSAVTQPKGFYPRSSVSSVVDNFFGGWIREFACCRHGGS